jgi:alpha-glucosidase
VKFGMRDGSYPPWWKEIEVVLYGWQSANPNVMLDGKAVSGSRYDVPNHALRVRIPGQVQGVELRVESR